MADLTHLMPKKIFSVDAYKQMLKNLLPRGPIWRNINETFEDLLEAMAVEFDRIDTRIRDLKREAIPGLSTSAEMLSDWEEVYLNEQEKPAAGDSEVVRQAVLHAKVTSSSRTPSKAFFIELGASLGMTITVQDIADGLASADVARVDEAVVEDDAVSEDFNVYNWQITVVADPLSQLTKLQELVKKYMQPHTIVTYV